MDTGNPCSRCPHDGTEHRPTVTFDELKPGEAMAFACTAAGCSCANFRHLLDEGP